MSRLRRDLDALNRALRQRPLRQVFNLRTRLNPDDGPSLNDLLDAILDLLRGRDDIALLGAQAVNLYVKPQRGTGDVDVATESPADLTKQIRADLARRFQVKTSVKRKPGGYSIYWEQPTGRDKISDVRARPVSARVACVIRDNLRVLAPDELTVSKVAAYSDRRARGSIKADTDRADLRRLLRTFPPLRQRVGAMLRARRAPPRRDRGVGRGAGAARRRRRRVASLSILIEQAERDLRAAERRRRR